jgi:tetratricopeptide (TPR) repeat protein
MPSSKRANADSYHGLGKFYLYQRDPDNAIQYLEQARQADGKDAQILADLGAAYFEKGKRELEAASADASNANGGKGLEDLGRSLEYLNQLSNSTPTCLRHSSIVAWSISRRDWINRQKQTGVVTCKKIPTPIGQKKHSRN